MPPAQRFDADAKSAERQKHVIRIGGRTFHPRKRTVLMMDEWNKAAPEASMDIEEVREKAKEDPLMVFRGMVKQLNVLLRDEESSEPGEDFLNEELDVEDGFILLDQLTPKVEAEEVEAGNSEPVASETDT